MASIESSAFAALTAVITGRRIVIVCYDEERAKAIVDEAMRFMENIDDFRAVDRVRREDVERMISVAGDATLEPEREEQPDG